MPHFVNSSRHYFLSTNYKVLYSLLYYQPSLQMVPEEKLTRHRWLMPLLSFHRWPHFLLVRDPYARVESFYKDKFRQAPLLGLHSYDELQRCQRFFCPYLQIDPGDSPTVIRGKLLSLSFDQFIHLLPQVYRLDGHLHPQVCIMTLYFRSRSMRLKFDRILKVESVTDLAYLQDKLAIDLSQKYNSTHTVEAPTRWQPDLRAVVNHLYKADFATFQYEMYTT